jgi:YHS domain-containing protein
MAEVKLKEFMKIRTILMTALAVVLVGGGLWLTPDRLLAQTNAPSEGQKILYYTCSMHPSVRADKPGKCPYCGMRLEAVYNNTDTTTNTAPSGTNSVTTADAKVKPYPLKTCVVDGMSLDSMGKPYVFVYQGQEIKLCCSDCKSEFLQSPDKYMKQIQAAEKK